MTSCMCHGATDVKAIIIMPEIANMIYHVGCVHPMNMNTRTVLTRINLRKREKRLTVASTANQLVNLWKSTLTLPTPPIVEYTE